jgi:ribosomal protein S18 acetylase RimI-like enzyme
MNSGAGDARCSVDADDHALEQVIDFLDESPRRQATRLVSAPAGFMVLDNDYPASYDHNKFVITATPAMVDPVAWVEHAFAQAMLAHRFVVANRDEHGLSVAEAFVGAGYHHERDVIMRYLAPPPDRSAHPSISVAEACADELADFDRRAWRIELPQVSTEVIEQLAARRATRLLVADHVAFLTVRAGNGDVVASADLYLDAGFGVAQIEDVKTDPAYRNRGLASALLAEGARRATDYGSDVLFLIADADGWPRHLYARLGYVEIGRSHVFSRDPLPG